jgi:hypothetical protein
VKRAEIGAVIVAAAGHAMAKARNQIIGSEKYDQRSALIDQDAIARTASTSAVPTMKACIAR